MDRDAEDSNWEEDDSDEEVEASDSDHRSRQAASILRDLNVSSIGNLPRAICQLLSENSAWTWTDDDVLDCVMRALHYRPTGPSKYWCIRKIDENTCHVELLDNSDGCIHAIRSQDDPAVEFYELKKNIQNLSSLLHVTCADVSSTCLKVQLPSFQNRAVSRIQYKTNTQNTSADNRMTTLVAEILNQMRTTCDGFDRKVEIVRKQINRERQTRVQQSIQAWLRGSTRIVHSITDVNRVLIDQEKRIKALEINRAITGQEKQMEVMDIGKINRALMSQEKRMKVLETSNAELVAKLAKLQFEKVLVEMKRKGFKSVLDQIAQVQREAKAARLGFGKVLREMKKKGFTRLLDEITASKRDAKAVELAKRLQQLQMEARAAGISLENIDLPIVMPEVVEITGIVSQFSSDIPLATPVSKQF